MNDNEDDLDELQFPLTVHFKVIGEVSEDLRTRLEIALCELNVHEPLHPGMVSTGGRYRTYNLSMQVPSREILRAIDARLRAVEGVKMVL
jgi:putative lipoic acid-binding regulatory protein